MGIVAVIGICAYMGNLLYSTPHITTGGAMFTVLMALVLIAMVGVVVILPGVLLSRRR